MNERQIEDILQNIFLQRTGIDFMKNNDKKDEVLWGQNLNIPVRNLVCVIIDVQNNIEIKFTDDDVDMKKIITYNGLLRNIIEKTKIV
ncbi:hypothetical protein [Extibacter muris]|uniref:hypothetical protein n=1 Tax=Extibacter muris TaxID=1796622 RepID=UPI001D085C85|nr:hypothetical protein [Extibacter muris]MCB6202211.1 hypothetical protein [Extibacter muris]MCQ4662646.1 hypothetical protein [Extibacter muris]MCQ4693071.1 hypothetical protein [Extibacter muris]